MVNIGYRLARRQGQIVRWLYKTALPKIVRMPIPQTCKVPLAVYSFSCDRDLPEQVASIRSFIRYVGIPDKFIVVSDGSYSPASCQLLRQISPYIEVVEFAKFINKDLPPSVYAYANIHPLGKKLAVLISLPVDRVTIYADSDILFFPAAEELLNLTNLSNTQPRYLLDCATALDERLLDKASEKFAPVNSGFMILQKPLNWEIPLKRLAALPENANYFTEQTSLHLAMHYNQGIPLTPEEFVVNRDDEFIYQDKHCSPKVALRHYVSPIRHKFWLSKVIWK
ncbi:hypothetical protein ACE1CI_24265 [Aerosakkonemataceae cyanobacterium BLCC-F50]|uniref:Glycosyltransferase n=1 Tax=Floridaenema flaviceps BLCC-F50 TaxID=3153642 RepID=A0ABV4XWC0_9CYAN